MFSCPGKVSNLMLKEKALRIFNLTSFENDEEDDLNLDSVANKIKSELNSITFVKITTLLMQKISDECSTTLSNLLSMITPKFNGSLASAMIGNIVTGTYTDHHTIVSTG